MLATGALCGRVEVICGPMFSGKTEELIRRVRRAQIARQKVQIFKPATDTRYHSTEVVSHSSQSLESMPVERSGDILGLLRDSTRVVAIDEVQFFDMGVLKVVERLASRGCRVICAGLDLDFRARPFGPIPELLACADIVDKLHAICTVCGGAASRSQRLVAGEDDVVLGGTESYEARCRLHFEQDDLIEQPMLPFRESSQELSDGQH